MKQKLLFLLVLLLTAATGAWAQSSLTCAEVYAKSKGTELALNDVVVTYVNNKYVYVKDATGYMLLYLTDSSGWTPGTILSNVTGTVDIYYGLHEVKLTSDQLMEVNTTTGDAPAPIEFTTAPVADDMNKYIVLKGVTVSNATFPSDKNMNVTIGEKTIVLRNQFNADVAFDTEKKYDITAVVSYYNTTVQAYFISATEASSSTPEPATYAVTFADDTAEPTLWNASPNADVKKGQTVTVTYTGTKKVIGVKAEKKAKAAGIVNPVVGQIIGSDGNNYDANATLPDGVTKVAMIAYVSGSNGLALALTDEEGIYTWDNSGLSNNGKTAPEICSALNTSKAVTGGTWKLPSQDEWKQMFSANGGNEGSYTGLNTAIGNAGGTALVEYDEYWSSSEFYDDAWLVNLANGNAIWDTYGKQYSRYVRACLAF